MPRPMGRDLRGGSAPRVEEKRTAMRPPVSAIAATQVLAAIDVVRTRARPRITGNRELDYVAKDGDICWRNGRCSGRGGRDKCDANSKYTKTRSHSSLQDARECCRPQ